MSVFMPPAARMPLPTPAEPTPTRISFLRRNRRGRGLVSVEGMSTSGIGHPQTPSTREVARLRTGRIWLGAGSAVALVALIAWAVVAATNGWPAGVIAATSGAVAVSVACSTGFVAISARARQAGAVTEAPSVTITGATRV